MWFLWRRADDDGVVRKQISERRLAVVLDIPKETVRKNLRYLDTHGYIRRVSGQGRTRSYYAVVRSFSLPITDPLAPPPDLAGADSQPPAGAQADPGPDDTAPSSDQPPGPEPESERDGLGQAGADSQPPAAAREQAGPAGTPPPAARPPAPRTEFGQADTTGWCADAILAGHQHQNRRCCHTTPRQIEKARRKQATAAALASEQEQVRKLGLGPAGHGRTPAAELVALARAETAAGIARAAELDRQKRERNHVR
jgi:hypothetical protein